MAVLCSLKKKISTQNLEKYAEQAELLKLFSKVMSAPMLRIENDIDSPGASVGENQR